MKRPFIGLLVQIVCGLFILGNAMEALSCFLLFKEFAYGQIILTFILNVAVVAFSLFIFIGIQKNNFKTRMAVTIYLWLMLLKYPIVNFLRSSGLHLPGSVIQDNELTGAAIAELVRYMFLLTVIIWSGFSKQLKKYFDSSNNQNQAEA